MDIRDRQHGVRQVLASLGSHTLISERGIVEVLDAVHQHPEILEKCSRSSVKRARAESVNIVTSVGPVLRSMNIPLEDAPDQSLEVKYIHPVSFLVHASKHCIAFGKFLQERHHVSPSSPSKKWQIMVYSDEITPGNQLAHDNKRKLQAIYWSFTECGHRALQCEALWFVLTCIRSKSVEALGGMSVLYSKLLQTFFEPASDMSMGVMMQFPSGTMAMMFADISINVADESALKQIVQNKGASGLLCCVCCQNVAMRRSDIRDFELSGRLVSSTETDVSKLVLHTPHSIAQIINMLLDKRPVLSNSAFGELETKLGFNLKLSGMLLTERFGSRMINTIMFDWMHVYLVKGNFNVEAGQLLALMHKNDGISHTDVHDYVQGFEYPARLRGGQSAKSVFEKRTDKLCSPLKCSASEALSAYGILRMFLMLKVMATASVELKAAIISYKALCDVLDLLQLTSSGKVRPHDLMQAILAHLNLYKSAHGTGAWIPKFHMSIHLPLQQERFGLLQSCFVHERKHKEAKRFSSTSKSTTRNWESGLLENVLRVHLGDLNCEGLLPTGAVFLESPKPASNDLANTMRRLFAIDGDVITGVEAVIGGCVKVHRGDVAVIQLEGRLRVAEVWFHICLANVYITCVSPWAELGNNTFKIQHEPVMIDTQNVQYTVVYRRTGDTAMVVPVRKS
jgi:hypothetical protein